MTIGEIYRRLRSATEPNAGERESTAIARRVMESVLGLQPVDLVIRANESVMPSTAAKIDEIATRLSNGEPVQYILGEAWFHGLKLHVAPGVLIPRPETSQLIDIVADLAGDRTDLNVVDLGTGSGAIAIALARTLRFAHVTAIDISAQALNIAKGNATALGTDIDFIEADMLQRSSLPEREWDIIVSNPPYIAPEEAKDMEPCVLDHEPHLALFAPDGDPLCFYRAAAEYAALTLREEGILAFEINPDYSRELEQMLNKHGFNNIETIRDFNGRQRFSIARR